MPRISLCVPTYNRAALLRQCVSSLLGQTADGIEVVVVDNCSTDGTLDIVREFLPDSRFRFVRNATNIGPQENWNRCVEIAQGDFIAICHDDDFYVSSYAEECSAFLNRHPSVGFVHCGYTVTDGNAKSLRQFLAYPADRVIPSRVSFLQFLRESHNIAFSSVMARRSTYAAVGRFRDGLICGDYDMWLRMALHADVGFLSRLLVYYRTHDDSMSLGVPISRWCDEHLMIIRDNIALAAETVPFLRDQQENILQQARVLWARRGYREALSRISYGNVEGARDCLSAARSLATSPLVRLQIWMAQLMMSRVGVACLRTLRPAWQYLQRG